MLLMFAEHRCHTVLDMFSHETRENELADKL